MKKFLLFLTFFTFMSFPPDFVFSYEIWSYEAGDKITCAVGDYADNTYLTAGSSLVSLDENGSLRWEYTADSRFDSVSVSGNRITAVSEKSVYYLTVSGSLTQTADIPGREKHSGFPVIHTDYPGVYAGYDSTVHCISENSEWETEISGGITYICSGTDVLYLATGSSITALDKRTGAILWEYVLGSSISADPVTDSDGNIHIPAESGYLISVSPEGTLLKKTGVSHTPVSASVAHNSVFVNDSYIIYAVESENVKWTYPALSADAPVIGCTNEIILYSDSILSWVLAGEKQQSVSISEYETGVPPVAGCTARTARVIHGSIITAVSPDLADTDSSGDDQYDQDGYDKNGYDREGYNKAGYDRNGCNRNGFNADGFDRSGFDKDGYDKDGYDRNGFNIPGYGRDGFDRNGFDKDGYSRDGYNKAGYDRNGCNRNGFDADGYDKNGFDADGFNSGGYDCNGYDSQGYDSEKYDRGGYNREGYNREGYDRSGFDKEGYNREGYDRSGYNAEGFDREGYNRKGFDADGYNRDGFDAEDYDREGYSQNGFNSDGYNRDGYNAPGFDREGYDRSGYNSEGYNSEGYDRQGFDILGYDSEGYDRSGYSKEGYNRSGFDRYGFDPEGFGAEGYNSDGFDREGYNREGFSIEGYSREGFNTEGYNREGYDREGYDSEGYNNEGFDRENRLKTDITADQKSSSGGGCFISSVSPEDCDGIRMFFLFFAVGLSFALRFHA